MSKIQISKSGKFSKVFPKGVADRIREIASNYTGIKSVTILNTDQTKPFMVSEGRSYIGIDSKGNEVGFETAAAHNVGASGTSNSINSKFYMAPYSYLIEVAYYNKYIMMVYKVGQNSRAVN